MRVHCCCLLVYSQPLSVPSVWSSARCESVRANMQHQHQAPARSRPLCKRNRVCQARTSSMQGRLFVVPACAEGGSEQTWTRLASRWRSEQIQKSRTTLRDPQHRIPPANRHEHYIVPFVHLRSRPSDRGIERGTKQCCTTGEKQASRRSRSSAVERGPQRHPLTPEREADSR